VEKGTVSSSSSRKVNEEPIIKIDTGTSMGTLTGISTVTLTCVL
jgi:hypothetical protein